jgi:CheY-like chemotaxis protein
VDLVITDLVMPTMGGRELVERIRQIAPAVRILRSSGGVFPPDQIIDLMFLQKPYTSHDLLIRVRRALATESHERSVD